MPKRPAKLGNNFFGDSGTMFNENTRDEIEKNAGAGHKGNDVGNSEKPDEAERMARTLHRMPEFRYAFFLNDPTEREKWVQRYREALNGQPNSRAKKAEYPEEAPSLSRAADDKFWSDPGEIKKAGKMVRPAKL
jgi:hypothetical protein